MCRAIAIGSTILTAILWAGALRAADENRPEPPRDRPRPGEDQKALFDRLDANHDGQITSDEVPEEHRRLFDRLLRRADKNNDGKISREEFMASQPEDRPAGPPDGPPRDGGPQEGRMPDGRPGERPEGPRGGGGFGGFGGGGFGAGGPGMPGPVMGIALFKALDTNSDGKLDAKEIAAAPEVLKKLANSEGEITREDLLKTMPGAALGGGGGAGGFGGVAAGLSPEAVLKKTVEQFDKNGDGKLQKDELPPRLQARFDELDTNKDGALDETELKGFLPQLMRRFQQGNAQNDGNPPPLRNLRRLMDAAGQPKPADKPEDKDKK